MLPFEDLPYLELPSVVENWVSEARERFLSAKERIRIFSGEAHWLLFSHPYIKNVLREKAKEGVPVSLVAGPILSAWREGPNLENLVSGVIDLVRENAITLYFRDKRRNDPHFIIIDDEVAYVEEAHKCLAPLMSRKRRKVEKGSDEYGFSKFVSLFNKYAKEESHNPEQDFVLLTPSQIEGIQNEVGSLDNLTKEDILKKKIELYGEA